MTDTALESSVRPAPAPATAAHRPPPWARAAWRQYRLERRLFWRNPSAAFFNFLLPLVFLALLGAVFADDPDALAVIVPGIAGMSVLGATFTSLAYGVTQLRERGLLKRVRGTPLPTSAFLAGIGGSAVANTLLQVGIIVLAGNLVFGVDWPRDWLALGVFLAAGVACFGALGVALAHLIPDPEAAPAYVNAAFLPMILISGVFYEDEDAPAVIREAAEILPLKHLVDGLSGAMVDGIGVAGHWTALGVLGLWGAVGLVAAVRGFSWDARRD